MTPCPVPAYDFIHHFYRFYKANRRKQMKWIFRILSASALLAVLAMIIFSGLRYLNNFKQNGSLRLEGLNKKVVVQRDAKGMAYIHAANMNDLLFAQGFVTAQDRLFQMELTKRLIQGRISEFAGRSARNLDIRMRTIGLCRMAKKQAAILNNRTKQYFQQYVAGINAFIDTCPNDIPLEFRLAGIKPEKWTIIDSLSIVFYMGYSTAANLKTEITAQMLLQALGYKKTSELLPLNFNADDTEDKGCIIMPPRNRVSESFILPKGLADYVHDRRLRVGSNNWAVDPSMSDSGGAILCGDPHLDPRILPGVWYPVGLFTPEIRAVGANIPGLPAMVIGRTQYIALAATNNYGDMLDLYIEKPDPSNPDNYLEGKVSIPFKKIHQTLKIKDKNKPGGFIKENFTIRLTRRGPVVSGIFPGLEKNKIITMRFAPAESMESRIGLAEVLTIKNGKQLVKALKHFPIGCFNWAFADSQGNIGFQASGRVPVRLHGDGTFPFPVTGQEDNWHGWIPADKMPGVLNPAKHWTGTCNHKTIAHDFPYYYSSFFAPSWRYRRLKELMQSSQKKTKNDMWSYQRDTKNIMAAKTAPIMAKALQQYEDTRLMGEILEKWNFHDDPGKAAPAIFQTTYCKFAELVFKDELGEKIIMNFLDNWYFWQEKLTQMVLKGHSIWFDDTTTPDIKESMTDMFHKAALQAKKALVPLLGNDPEQWKWGKIHTLELVNPLARKGIAGRILGTGPMPMGGSGETLYRGWYDYDKPFEVTHCAALRMVVDMSDMDKVMAVIPGGVSARTFSPHQKDQIKNFMSGKKSYWWFSDTAIDRHEKSRLVLVP